jgi:hypothetical protein
LHGCRSNRLRRAHRSRHPAACRRCRRRAP